MIFKNAEKNSAQMIAILGIILAISVIVLSSISSEIANIDFVVSTQSSSTLVNEFEMIKSTFGASLNYNLADVVDYNSDGNTSLVASISDIQNSFNQTKFEYYNIELRRGNLFDANLKNYIFTFDGIDKYNVEVTLLLDDGYNSISEDVVFTLVFTPKK
jgi:hypothetical protein